MHSAGAQALRARAAAVSVVFCFARSASADDAPAAPPLLNAPVVEVESASAPTTPVPPDANIALVASGGVSLGAYQAGFAYLSLWSRQLRYPERRLALAAGTSAGSANALLAALGSCTGPAATPDEDLGWKTWVPVGLGSLFDPAEVTPVSVFTRQAMLPSIEAIWETYRAGLPKDCDVVLAFTITRLDGHGIRVRPDFVVPRQEEKIRLRLQGRGRGVPPKLTNYVNPRFHLPQMVLNLRMDDHRLDSARHNFEQLVDVIFASTGFPVAFAPQPVEYCLLKPRGPDDEVDPEAAYCPEPTHRDLFVDGGVFENYPLRLAERVAHDGLRADERGRSYWRDLTKYEDSRWSVHRPPVFYAYIDPFRAAYPPMTEAATATKTSSVLELISTLGSNFILAARGKELFAAVAEDADLAEHMFLSSTSYPPASSPLSAFMGFMDRDLRSFDFHLGMYDALVLLQSQVLPGGSLPFARNADIPDGWRRFACMLAAFDPAYAALMDECSRGPSTEFRVLLQVALDRMHDHCRRIAPAELELSAPHPRCEAASRGEPRPVVPGLRGHNDEAVIRRSQEDHFDHTMRLLELYGFAFDELGVESEHVNRNRLYVRRALVDMAEALAEAQPKARDAALIRSVAHAAAAPIARDPPKLIGWALLGTVLEGGVSGYPSDDWPTWLRLTAAFQYKGWTSLLTDEPVYFIGAATAGLEVEVQPLANSLFSPYAGLRAGGQLSTRDTLGTGGCTPSASLGDGRNCSQALVQAYAAGTALGWLRLQLQMDVYPAPPSVRSFDPATGEASESRRYLGFQLVLGGQFQ